MSEPSSIDPRLEQAGASDESILAAHEKLLGKKPDERAHYKLTPLVLLFVFSGIIFYAGTYLNHYAAHYDSSIFDEHGQPALAGAVAVKADPLVLGKKNYILVCATCHQANGMGVPGVYPPLAGSDWVDGSEERLVRILVHGLKGPLKVKGVEYGTAAMPAFGKIAGSGYSWSDEKIAAVLTYIRQEWGHQARPITTEQVAAIRTKEGDRKEWTQDELLALP